MRGISIVRFKAGMMIIGAVALLGGCARTPPPPAAVPVAVVVPTNPYPEYRWSQGNAPRAHEEATALFGPLALRPGDHRWADNIAAKGEAKVVIDLRTQLFYVYQDDRLVGVSTISSGKKGKETQLGFWSVMIKKRNGFSRKYDNAPMPFMQMYDHKGLAFHAGKLPGYPASHGCVRLPLKFAQRLFGMTRIGTKVIIEG
jgi:lipoprotein-anchoring transpeptidase ErfK/SrfK